MRRRLHHNPTVIHILTCTTCKGKFPIPRSGSTKTKNHLKTIYCPYCKTERQFIENIDKELLRDENLSEVLSDVQSLY